jgi:hypothetical protein
MKDSMFEDEDFKDRIEYLENTYEGLQSFEVQGDSDYDKTDSDDDGDDGDDGHHNSSKMSY